jgi:hypothetical protein
MVLRITYGKSLRYSILIDTQMRCNTLLYRPCMNHMPAHNVAVQHFSNSFVTISTCVPRVLLCDSFVTTIYLLRDVVVTAQGT